MITLGKCKALWGKPRTLLRLSQRSTELSCTSFDESLWWRKIEKAKSIDEQRCGTVFFCVNLREYISPRTSSTVVRVQVVGVCEIRTSAGMPRLVIVLDPACACRWERRRTLKKLYSRSQLAPSWSVKDKSNSVVCQKKKPFVAELSISCGEAYTTVSCNDSIVLSNRLSRWARKSENKRTCFDAGWPWGKRKSRLPWLDGIQFRSPNNFCTVVQCWQPNAKAKLRQVRSVTNSKTNVKEHVHMYQ